MVKRNEVQRRLGGPKAALFQLLLERLGELEIRKPRVPDEDEHDVTERRSTSARRSAKDRVLRGLVAAEPVPKPQR
jgi:hypothetical protein